MLKNFQPKNHEAMLQTFAELYHTENDKLSKYEVDAADVNVGAVEGAVTNQNKDSQNVNAKGRKSQRKRRLRSKPKGALPEFL